MRQFNYGLLLYYLHRYWTPDLDQGVKNSIMCEMYVKAKENNIRGYGNNNRDSRST